MSLQVRQYPEVEETTITITTTYVGASADLMQGFISTPIAKSVSSAEGVDYVTSQSRLGVSTVSVRMRLNTDPNAALTEVTAKVQQVRAQLPHGRGRSGHHEGHGPDLRADVPHLREFGDEFRAGFGVPDAGDPASVRHAGRRRRGRNPWRARVLHAGLARSATTGGARGDCKRCRWRRSAPATSSRHRARPRTSLRRLRASRCRRRSRRLRRFGNAADPLQRRSARAPSRRGGCGTRPEEHRHQGQLQRQGRHLHRHHPDARGAIR